MAPGAACVRERRRTYAGCRDLHQTPPVLAAVSGGRQALRERDPPSFGPRQEDLRICFETPEYGQEPHGHASEAPCCIANIIVRCNMAAARHLVKNLAGVSCDGAGLLGIGPGLLVGLLTRLIIGRLLLRRLLRIPGGVPVSRKEEIQPPNRSLTSRLGCTA